MAKEYEISEKDIESTVRFLKTVDPPNANPDNARAFLEELQAGVHSLAHTDPESLEKLYLELKLKKRP